MVCQLKDGIRLSIFSLGRKANTTRIQRIQNAFLGDRDCIDVLVNNALESHRPEYDFKISFIS